jgi:hypothetical protein
MCLRALQPIAGLIRQFAVLRDEAVALLARAFITGAE